MIFIEFEDSLLINSSVIDKWRGIAGLRDQNLLKSALHNPQNIYFYENANLYQIASKYAFSIIQNHPFLDGNKRTGFACMNAFLELNNIILKFPEDEAVEMMVKIATKTVAFDEVVEWLISLKKI